MENERRLHFLLFENIPTVIHYSGKITSLLSTALMVFDLLV